MMRDPLLWWYSYSPKQSRTDRLCRRLLGGQRPGLVPCVTGDGGPWTGRPPPEGVQVTYTLEGGVSCRNGSVQR